MSNKGKPSLLTRIKRVFAAAVLIVIGGETALLYRIYDFHGMSGLLNPAAIGQTAEMEAGDAALEATGSEPGHLDTLDTLR